jgi:hypothetical protein
MVRSQPFIFILAVFVIQLVNVVVGFQLKRSGLHVASISSDSIRYRYSVQSVCDSSAVSTRQATYMTSTNVEVRGDYGKKIEKQQPRGIFNIVGASAKFFVSGVATLVLYSTDSWVPLYYILGAVLNGALSRGMKNTLKQPRPPQSDKGGYGMPSSHTQSFFFFLTAVSLNSLRFMSFREAIVLSLLILLYSCVASYWRVVSGVHSLSQVL